MADESIESTIATAEPAAAPAPPNGATAPAAAPAGDWKATLIPEAIRGEKLWDRFKDPAAAFQSHLELQKTMGNAVRVPGPDAKPEEIAAFHKKLGVPDSPAGYKPPEGIEGLDPGRWQMWSTAMHRLGLTPAQVEGLARLDAEERQGMGAQLRRSYEEGLNTWRGEIGEKAFAREVTLAKRAIDRHGTPELKAFLDESGLGDHPLWIKAWASVGNLHAEDGYVDGRVEGVPTAEDAKRRIGEIRANPVYRGGGPAARALQDELEGLYKLVHGTSEKVA